MMLLDRDFNSSSIRNIARENGTGSSPLWFQAAWLYVMRLLSERVNFQVSRKRSFVRVPKPLRTSVKSLIEVALYVRLYSRTLTGWRADVESQATSAEWTPNTW